jgi:valyl-tRNA synthetase
VRDAEKQKMSKTKGNVIDPLVVTEKYGTDAVRMALLQGAAPGTDIVLTEERMAASQAFANKIWNAARFLFLKMEASGVEPPFPEGEALEGSALEDRWMFSRLDRCAEQANRAIEQYRYHEAAQTLWHFFWHEFCDWYVELKKPALTENSGITPGWRNLLTVFEKALRLLHPAMPFITEELWQRVAAGAPGQPKSIALAAYPQPQPGWRDEPAEREMELLQDIIVAARNLRAQLKIDPKEPIEATLHARGLAFRVAEENAEAIHRLARVRARPSRDVAPERGVVKRSTPDYDLVLHVPAGQAEALRESLGKEVTSLERLAGAARRQLSDAQFLANAPAEIVEGRREKLAEYEAQLERSTAMLAGLG